MKTENFLKDKILEKDDIKLWFAVAVAVVMCRAKLFISYTQFATIYPPLAPIDDDMMFRAAQSIVRGEWLGRYNWLTLSKHAFFALWLAFLHLLHIPFMVGNMALWMCASFVCTLAFKPVEKKRWARLVLFLALVYNPATSRQYATRVYRDAIFPALCLMFFSGIIAVGLRYKENAVKWLGWGAVYGLAFGCIYLCREDGIWVLPFALCAFVVVGVLVAMDKKDVLKKCAAMLAPFTLSALVIGAYCYKNYQYYGRFIVSDFTSKEFKSAYGAMASLEQDEWNPMVAVPADVRADIYREVPVAAPLEDALKNPLIVNGYMGIGDFASGSFYWALRNALDNLGVYDTPQSAESYYIQLTREIQTAVNEGRLKTQNGGTKLRVSVTPPIKMRYVPGVWAETWRGLGVAMTFRQCDPLAMPAVGTPEEIQTVENFIHQKGDIAYIPGTDVRYLSPARTFTHGLLKLAAAVYGVLVPALVLVGLCWQIKKLIFDINTKNFDNDSMLNIVMLGLIGMALLRCAMIAFVEVSSFGIGTYVMYLSTVHPLLIAYGFVGLLKTFEE